MQLSTCTPRHPERCAAPSSWGARLSETSAVRYKNARANPSDMGSGQMPLPSRRARETCLANAGRHGGRKKIRRFKVYGAPGRPVKPFGRGPGGPAQPFRWGAVAAITGVAFRLAESPRQSGEIGIHARFRTWFPQGIVGSSPTSGTRALTFECPKSVRGQGSAPTAWRASGLEGQPMRAAGGPGLPWITSYIGNRRAVPRRP